MLAHLLGTNQQTQSIVHHEQLNNGSPGLEPQERVVTVQIWRITYTQLWTKRRGLCRFEKFSNKLRGIMNLKPSHPRFLARLPRWQQRVKFVSS